MGTQATAQVGELTRTLKLGVILTGGTIGTSRGPDGILRVDGKSGGLSIPESTSIHVVQPLRMLSENMRPHDWVTIAKAVRSLVEEEVSGVVVLHGTDTMGYTSAALSFLLAGLDVPVVLTGSNIAPLEPDSDAATNIYDAFVVATALPAGVFVSFSGMPGEPSLIHLGTRVRKGRAEARAFSSIGLGCIGEVKEGRVLLNWLPLMPVAIAHAKYAVDEKVFSFILYPGCPLDAIKRIVCSEGYRGVVVELYPSATGPDHDNRLSLDGFTQMCTDEGVVVVGVVREGLPLSSGPYESTRRFTEAGGMLLGNILPETATVKVMWALGQSRSFEAVRQLIRTAIAGEFY
ncbi:MAG: asparaginase [Acidimicrobiales bacterium]